MRRTKMMSNIQARSNRRSRTSITLGLLAALVLFTPTFASAGKKKASAQDDTKKVGVPDYSNIVWPNPPAIARIKYTTFYASEQISQAEEGTHTQKAKWMDRLAGTQPQAESNNVLWQLAEPYG